MPSTRCRSPRLAPSGIASRWFLVTIVAAIAGCGSSGSEGASGSTGSGASPIASSTSSSEAPVAEPSAPLDRTGGAVARLPRAHTIAIADEDHLVVRIVDVGAKPPVTKEVTLPGRPAQVLALPDAILVTVRDPGLLLRLVPDGDTWKIAGAAKLPADAWGVAVTADRSRALVSSAWSRTLSAIDLNELAKGGEIEPIWKVGTSPIWSARRSRASTA